MHVVTGGRLRSLPTPWSKLSSLRLSSLADLGRCFYVCFGCLVSCLSCLLICYVIVYIVLVMFVVFCLADHGLTGLRRRCATGAALRGANARAGEAFAPRETPLVTCVLRITIRGCLACLRPPCHLNMQGEP